MPHHFVANILTTAGPLKLGLSNISRDKVAPAFEALMTTLGQVSDPITLEDKTDNITVYEVRDRSPEVALQFEYLGAKTTTFPTEEAFHAYMNQSLAIQHFPCLSTYEKKVDGSVDVVLENFLLVDRPPVEH